MQTKRQFGIESVRGDSVTLVDLRNAVRLVLSQQVESVASIEMHQPTGLGSHVRLRVAGGEYVFLGTQREIDLAAVAEVERRERAKG